MFIITNQNNDPITEPMEWQDAQAALAALRRAGMTAQAVAL